MMGKVNKKLSENANLSQINNFPVAFLVDKINSINDVI